MAADYPMPDNGTHPAAELLLCCLRARFDPEFAPRVEVLARTLRDWDALIAIAEHHRVVPHLYQVLKHACPDAVPAARLAQLGRTSDLNAAYGYALAAELLRLLPILEAAGVSAVPFKGPLLAHTAYGNLGLRQCIDLDILVRRRDVPRASEVLLSHGYSQLEPPTDYHESFLHRDGWPCVEVHRDFASRYAISPIDLDGLWNRLETTTMLGAEIRSFSAPDLLLILCIHGAKHFWERLGWICDIASLVDRCGPIDWDALLNRVRKSGHERILLLGLRLAGQATGISTPPRVERLIRSDRMVDKLAGYTWERLFRPPSREGAPYDSWVYYINLSERLRDRFRRRLFYLRIAVLLHPAGQAPVPILGRFAIARWLYRGVQVLGRSVADPAWIGGICRQLCGQPR